MVGAILLPFPRNGMAVLHNEQPDLVNICNDCHTLNSLLQESNTSLIRAGVRTLPTMKSKNGGAQPAAFGCTFCHWNDGRSTYMRDSLDHFAGKPSQHPVDRGYAIDSARRTMTLSASTNTTRWMSNWDNSWGGLPSNQIGCVDCHDVTNSGYSSTTGVPGGYPNHVSPELRTANPFMLRGGSSSWSSTDNHATNAFCLSQCHDGGTPAKSAFKMGHYGWGSFDNGGTLGTLKEHNGTSLKSSRCVDCHETHYATMKPNLMGEAGETARTSISQANYTVDTANCTNICHANTRFVAGGHGKAGVNQVCSSCHTSTVSHRDSTNVRRFSLPVVVGDASLTVDLSTNGLDDNFDGVIDDAGEAAMMYSGLSVCQTCHGDKNLHQGAITGNTTTSGKTAGCLHCHDAHGNGTDNNLKMIRRNLLPGNKTAYYWTDKADYMRADGNSVCDNPSCHGKSLGNTSTPGTILYDVQEHRDANVGPGYNCGQCHSHSSATGAPSFSAQCNSCHAYPGQTMISGTHALSAVHDKHVNSEANGGYGLTCSVCHYQNTHNQANLIDPAQWGTLVNPTLVNIRFDGTWNPLNVNGPRYAAVLADNTQVNAAPGVGGSGICAGLYCHGNSAAIAPSWPAGGNTTPSWNTASSGACGTCHKYLVSDPPLTFAHQKHADNTTTGYGISCRKCHYQTTNDGLTIASRSAHLNRQSNVTFDTTDTLLSSGVYGGTPAVGDSGTSTGTCSNIYCHSPGNRMTAPFDNGALGTPDWNQGALACNACHGSLLNSSGSPAYVNGTPKINSHPRHIVMGYGCRVCHVNTTATDNTIASRANHANGIYNVNPDNAAHNFTTPYVSPTCSAIACHGNNAAAWGGTPPLCGQCHLSSVDTDQYQTASATWFNNDVTGTISNTEWSFSGHGKTSATYTISGHNAADFPGGAGTGDPCTYCHDSSVAHRVATNPFRLKDQTGVSGYATAGWNATCLVCHSKTQTPPGYTPPGVPFTRNSALTDRVDTAHYGTLHVGDNTLGGRLCWDCHDGHGDGADSSGNIYMIQKQTLSKTDGVYGYRGTSGTQTGAIVFANDNAPLSGGDWADNTGPYDGICNVCHTTAGHYKTASGDNHNRDKKCTDCHSHDTNFAASCNACHGEATGVGANGMPPYAPSSSHPWASRTTVDNLSNLAGVGDHRTATGIASSSHESFACSECHTASPGSDAAHDTGKDNASMTQIAALHGWTGAPVPMAASWSGGALAGAVAGGSVVDDSCSNINCHSPFYNSNAARSGTPNPYTRYWINSTRWDCYTCHGYNGVDNTNRPTKETVGTGSHGWHVFNWGYACTSCHANNAGNLNHKNGVVDLSMSGPLGAVTLTGTYTTTPAMPQPPTDGSGTNRQYGTCANTYCHSDVQKNNPDGLPNDGVTYIQTNRWGVGNMYCDACHKVGPTISLHDRSSTDNLATGSHGAHMEVSGRVQVYASGDNTQQVRCLTCHWLAGDTTNCSNGCHTPYGNVLTRHANGYIDMGFHGTLGSVTVSGVFDNNGDHLHDNVMVPGMPYGSCESMYCHGNGTPALTGGANQAGTPNIAKWGDPNTALCGSCHGGPGGATNYPGKASNYPTSGAHARHAGDNVIGPNPSLACTDCHTASTVSTHVDGRVDFKTAFNDNTATTKALTQVCDPCHGSGVATAKGNWDTAAVVDCLTCHGSTAAYTYANGTGRVAPNMAGDNSTYGSNVRGHNRPAASGVYPGTGNPAANRTCDSCHRLSLQHINNVNDNSFAGNRLLDNVNGGTSITTVSGLCAACHTTSGTSPATKKGVNTHGNAGFTGRLEAVFTGLECAQCHEPHGMVNVSTGTMGVNLWMINPTITVTTGVTVSPVRLFAKSGTNSFNAYDPGATNELNASMYNSNAADQLCVVCHANTTSNPGQPMTRNISGRHNAPGYTGNEAGKDCSGCHSHNQDGAIGTVDGLMPLSCNGCHSYPGLDNTGTNLKQMSAGHWKHVGQPLPAGNGTNNKGYDCTLCHFGYTHNQGGYAPGQVWPATYYDNVNVNFDNSWNPGSTTYRGLAVPTTGNGGTGACAGLYCHGGNATLNAGWGGSATSPSWNGTASCGACHDTGTADTTPGTVLSTKNHPVHIDNASKPYGPGAGYFTATNTCSDGIGCHTRWDLNPGGLHANNAKNLRSTASDNGYVASTLAATQVCVNCHGATASSQGTGDTLVRTQSNWDNNAYKVACVTCHNNGTQGWQNLNGTGNQAPNIDVAYYGNGHGAASIDNNSTTTDSGLVDQVPPVRCETCHDETGLHIGTAKDGTNPWRLDNTATNYTQTGGLDRFCLTQCHSQTALPPRHARIVNGTWGVAKDNALHTHPTANEAVATGKGRWYQVTADTTMPMGGTTASPLTGNLTTKSPAARTTGTLLACVTCHDPHGVGTAATAARTFSGANDNGFQMLRYKSGTLKNLCTKCHL